jgi:hypothetical protein
VLTGPAGCGKSVSAAALARDETVRERYPGGVVWVGPHGAESAPLRLAVVAGLASQEPVLFIHDSPVAPSWLLNRPRSAAVVTTSSGSQWKDVRTVDVEWSRSDAELFLQGRYSSLGREALAPLWTGLQGNPAALRLLKGQASRGLPLERLLLDVDTDHVGEGLWLVSTVMTQLRSTVLGLPSLRLCVFTPGYELSEKAVLDVWGEGGGRQALSELVELGILESAAGNYRVPGLIGRWLEGRVLDPHGWRSLNRGIEGAPYFRTFHRALLAALNPDGAPWSELEGRPDIGAYVTRMRTFFAADSNEETKRNGLVFLSYARQDADDVGRLAKALNQRGLEVRMTQRRIAGTASRYQLERAIDECDTFIPCISSQALETNYVQEEWQLAIARRRRMGDSRRFIFPVALDDTSASDLTYLADVHWTWLNRGDRDANIAKLVSEVEDAVRESQGAKKPPPQQAAATREAPLLGLASELTCNHGLGKVVIKRRAAAGDEDVLTAADLSGASIVGCPNIGPAVKPCTTVLSPSDGLSSIVRGANGSPALTQAVRALTDGTPPGVAGVKVRVAAPARLGSILVVDSPRDPWSVQTRAALEAQLLPFGLELSKTEDDSDGWLGQMIDQCRGSVVLLSEPLLDSKVAARAVAGIVWRRMADPDFRVLVACSRDEISVSNIPGFEVLRQLPWLIHPPDEVAGMFAAELVPRLVPPLPQIDLAAVRLLHDIPKTALAHAAQTLGLEFSDAADLPVAVAREMMRRGLSGSITALASLRQAVPREQLQVLVEWLATAWVPRAVTDAIDRVARAEPGSRLGWLVEPDYRAASMYLQAFAQTRVSRPTIVTIATELGLGLDRDIESVLRQIGEELDLPKPDDVSALRVAIAADLVLAVIATRSQELVERVVASLPELAVLVPGALPLWEDPRFEKIENPEPEVARRELAAYEQAMRLLTPA